MCFVWAVGERTVNLNSNERFQQGTRQISLSTQAPETNNTVLARVVIYKLRAQPDSTQHATSPFPVPTPSSLGFIIYDQVSLNETASKSSFLFHTDNIIFIKLIFQEALFYSDLPEPGEIILFFPLGLKENLSITNVYQ